MDRREDEPNMLRLKGLECLGRIGARVPLETKPTKSLPMAVAKRGCVSVQRHCEGTLGEK